jgi:hypothetical protein
MGGTGRLAELGGALAKQGVLSALGQRKEDGGGAAGALADTGNLSALVPRRCATTAAADPAAGLLRARPILAEATVPASSAALGLGLQARGPHASHRPPQAKVMAG